MKSVAILLTDSASINEKLLIKSLPTMRKSKIKKIYFIGDFSKFSSLRKKISGKKFNLINEKIIHNNFFHYINEITNIAIHLLKKKTIHAVINMPLNKKKFFKNKFVGFTEFFSYKNNSQNNENMLLFNDKFSVCPVTTHLQLKKVSKNINTKKIIKTVENLNYFFLKKLKKKINIKILGLNPHSGVDMNSKTEEVTKIIPAINFLKKKIKRISGPHSPDTAFLSTKNSLFVGMYHDQVLIPFKTINKLNAINITIGAKYLRLSPDHGTAKDKINKKIDITSFVKCIKFCEKYL